MFARVVFNLPPEGPFDYFVPGNLQNRIKVGIRVKVSFGKKIIPGYVVKVARKTKIAAPKPLLKIIDDFPFLDRNLLLLTKKISEYYYCSWGQAIHAALPEVLKRGGKIPISKEIEPPTAEKSRAETLLLHSLEEDEKWKLYFKEIKENLVRQKSVIVLLPDITSVLKTKEETFSHLGVTAAVLYRKEPHELKEWLRIREEKVSLVLGTRSAVFSPVSNLGLMIIDREEDGAYKQDQVPYYHARQVAFLRANIEKAKLILGSKSPSLESFYLAKTKKIKYLYIPRKRNYPEIKIIGTRRKEILSKYLQDSIALALQAKEKVLLFLNRRGYATRVACHNCGLSLKCRRCDINLIFLRKENVLRCHYCNFKMPPPQICPHCQAGYIKYFGVGVEKVENELSRLFGETDDIVISTASIVRRPQSDFGMIGVLGLDNSLSRIDFRAAEKTFALLVGLLDLTKKKVVIQTNLMTHHCLQALQGNDYELFYRRELLQRKELSFPPYKHVILVKARGKNAQRVKKAAESLFNILSRHNKSKNVEIVLVNPAHPEKLRDNFYWQVLLKMDNPCTTNKFLKRHLRKISHSGIIVTVDVDPL